MFEDVNNSLNKMFGKVAPGMCRITMNGGIAVKCSNGYKTYNVDKGTLTNVTNFSIPFGDEMFFILPTSKVKVGDIIIANGRPKCVTAVDKKSITVIDYENSEERKIVPERHIFMGSTYFYGKIVSLFGKAFKDKKGTGDIMKMMLISQMLGGSKKKASGRYGEEESEGFGGFGGFGGDFGSIIAMSALMGGSNNLFDGMFDSLDFGIDADDDDDAPAASDDKDKEE